MLIPPPRPDYDPNWGRDDHPARPVRGAPENFRLALPLRRYLQTHDLPCPQCRQNLRGIERSRCPECGTDVADHVLACARSPTRRGRGWWFGLVMLVFGSLVLTAMRPPRPRGGVSPWVPEVVYALALLTGWGSAAYWIARRGRYGELDRRGRGFWLARTGAGMIALYWVYMIVQDILYSI